MRFRGNTVYHLKFEIHIEPRTDIDTILHRTNMYGTGLQFNANFNTELKIDLWVRTCRYYIFQRDRKRYVIVLANYLQSLLCPEVYLEIPDYTITMAPYP